MELTDTLALVKAGYTKDEIAQMDKQAPANADTTAVPQPVNTPVQEAEPAKQTAQVDKPAAVAVPAAVPQPAQAEPTTAELMQAIAKLTSAVQANAIAQSVIPGGATGQQPAAEDMLAEIIRPTYHQRGD